MGCGSSSSSSSTGSHSLTAGVGTTAGGGRQRPTKLTRPADVGTVRSSGGIVGSGRGGFGNGGGGGGIILPADNGSPPSGSHRASRVSVAPRDDPAAAAPVAAAVAAAATGSVPTSSRASRQSLRGGLQPRPSTPPSQSNSLAVEGDHSSWRADLLAELNRQRRQVFSPDLGRLNLSPELSAVAQREADRLAAERVTVVSPAIDAEALDRSKAGVRCHAMSRVLTREESLNLPVYLAGLMAAMKAKEEDMVDRDQLGESDAAFWTLNGSFGCARATFQIVDEADAEAIREEFTVLAMVFCMDSQLYTITAAAAEATSAEAVAPTDDSDQLALAAADEADDSQIADIPSGDAEAADAAAEANAEAAAEANAEAAAEANAEIAAEMEANVAAAAEVATAEANAEAEAVEAETNADAAKVAEVAVEETEYVNPPAEMEADAETEAASAAEEEAKAEAAAAETSAAAETEAPDF